MAVVKPSGIASQPDSSKDTALIDYARDYIKSEFAKPGAVYLALLHRLDRPTSGIILMARTDKAAGRMSELFRRREVEKYYLALVECHVDPAAEAQLTNCLAPGSNGNMLVQKTRNAAGKEARLSYQTISRSQNGQYALLYIDLATGVKHQIRCQLAHIGLPLLGDFRYGPFGKPARPAKIADGHAILLHAAKVSFVHPVKRAPLSLAAPPPRHWDTYLAEFPALTPEILMGEKGG